METYILYKHNINALVMYDSKPIMMNLPICKSTLMKNESDIP